MSKNSKTGWKVVRIVTALLLIAFIVFVVVNLVDSLTYSGSYPYPTIAGTVNNWVDRFIVAVGIFSPFYLTPLTASVVLFIVSCVVLRKR